MRKVLKWLLYGWVGLWALAFLVILVGLWLHDPVPDSSVLRVELDGELTEAPQPSLGELFEGEPLLTLPGLTSALRAAAKDPRIVGVVLVIKDPSLSVAQVEEVEEAMAKVRESGKWTAAHLETAGEFARGDGAFALAATAEHVVLGPSGDVNLTGLRAEVPFVRGALDKLDIEPYFDKRYDYKTAVNTFTQTGFTKEHAESLKILVDSLQVSLIEHLARRREVEPKVVREWMASGPHAAAAAKERGLVDDVGYWDVIQKEAEERAGRDTPFVDVTTYATDMPSSGSGPKLAVVYGEGPIVRGEGGRNVLDDDGAMGSDVITAAFREARKADVQGILFRVDSPGGSYVASDLIRREVELCREAQIPVVVSMGGMAASGGYFIAMGADHIVADPGTITGSIGVYAGSFALRQFFARYLGLTFGVYETVPESNAFQNLDAPDAGEKAARAAMLDRIYEDFVQKAAAGRKKTRDEIHAVAQGRVWTGKEALERGLVDELGGMHVALRRLKEKVGADPDAPAQIVEFPEPESPLHVLRRLLGADAAVPAALSPARDALAELLAHPADRVLALPFTVHLR